MLSIAHFNSNMHGFQVLLAERPPKRNFNIHVNDHTDDNAIQFVSLLDHASLTQNVLFPTLGSLILLILS